MRLRRGEAEVDPCVAGGLAGRVEAAFDDLALSGGVDGDDGAAPRAVDAVADEHRALARHGGRLLRSENDH